jgi:hypothetical protein
MRYNKKRLAVVIAAAGLVIAAGAAYTDGMSTTAALTANPGYHEVGYGSISVSGGATLVAVEYNLDGNDPANVTSVTFVVAGNTTGDEGYVGFGGTATLGAACDPSFDDQTGAPADVLLYAADTTYAGCKLPAAFLPAGIPVGTTTLASLDLAVIPGPAGGGPIG